MVTQALTKNGFDGEYFPTGEEAAKKVIELRMLVNTIGVAGTITIRELNILDVLEGRDKKTFDIWNPSLSPEELPDTRRAPLTCWSLFDRD